MNKPKANWAEKISIPINIMKDLFSLALLVLRWLGRLIRYVFGLSMTFDKKEPLEFFEAKHSEWVQLANDPLFAVASSDGDYIHDYNFNGKMLHDHLAAMEANMDVLYVPEFYESRDEELRDLRLAIDGWKSTGERLKSLKNEAIQKDKRATNRAAATTENFIKVAQSTRNYLLIGYAGAIVTITGIYFATDIPQQNVESLRPAMWVLGFGGTAMFLSYVINGIAVFAELLANEIRVNLGPYFPRNVRQILWILILYFSPMMIISFTTTVLILLSYFAFPLALFVFLYHVEGGWHGIMNVIDPIKEILQQMGWM